MESNLKKPTRFLYAGFYCTCNTFCAVHIVIINALPASGSSLSPPNISPEGSCLFLLLGCSVFDLVGGVGESRGVFSTESSRPGKSSSESKLISSLLGFALLAKNAIIYEKRISAGCAR